MFTYQLDLGSLAIWQYSLRTSCDYLRGAPGSAALHDASWRGGGSIQRQPSTLNRSVAEFLTDLMACVTLLADGKVRTEIGPLRDVASLHEKLREPSQAHTKQKLAPLQRARPPIGSHLARTACFLACLARCQGLRRPWQVRARSGCCRSSSKVL